MIIILTHFPCTTALAADVLNRLNVELRIIIINIFNTLVKIVVL